MLHYPEAGQEQPPHPPSHPPPSRAKEKGRLPGELKPRRKQGRGKAPWHTGCSWQLGARRPPVLPQASPLPWIMPTGCGGRGRGGSKPGAAGGIFFQHSHYRGRERALWAGLSGAGTGILSVSTQLGSRTAEASSPVRGMLFACG